MLTGLFAGGRIVDVALTLIVLEAAVLFFRYRRGFSRHGPADFLPHLTAGACLLAALRLALTGASLKWMAVALLGALTSHLIELRQVWRA